MKVRVCELCAGEAALYCLSDSAFLCWSCDAKVHEANFLVARHIRRAVCSKCKGFTGDRISGAGDRPLRPICRSCSPESTGDDVDCSSYSACFSSTESCASPPKIEHLNHLKAGTVVSSSSGTDVSSCYSKSQARFSGEVTSGTGRKRRAKTKTVRSEASLNMDSKAEGIFVNWCTKLGVRVDDDDAVRMARHAFGVCLNELPVLPFLVALAASLWLGLRFSGDTSASTWNNLKRLQDMSGAPAKLILSAESKIARAFKQKKPRLRQQEEGWDECSP